MRKRTIPCRVCGKEFIPCGKSSAEIGAFNYMEVACCAECGAEYLRRVLTGRTAVADKTEAQEEHPDTPRVAVESNTAEFLFENKNTVGITKSAEKSRNKKYTVSASALDNTQDTRQ